MRNPVSVSIFLFVLTPLANTFAQTYPSSVDISSNIVVAGGTRNYGLRAHSASVNGVVSNQMYTLNYNNTANVRINNFTYGGNSYANFALFDTIVFRRAANAWVNSAGDKQHIYTEGPNNLDNTTYTLNMPVAYPVSSSQSFMMRAIRDGYINRGSDNVFNNDSTSDLTYNNVERIDFIYRLGIASLDPSKAGFLITERGGNDPFKIAAITAVDASGNPTAFGPVLPVATSAYGSPIANAFTYVMRKDVTDNDIRLFSKVPNQQVKAVYISLQSLGVASLQKIYGYALMGNDVTAATSAQVLDFTNTTYFPRNTNNANGGMDLASAPGIFHTNMILAGHYFNLAAQKRNCGVVLNWTDKEHTGSKTYTIEKSYNNLQFEPVNTVPVSGEQYSYTDNQVKNSVFYRIKIAQRNGNVYYSDVVNVTDVCETGTVSVYPNPATNNISIAFGGKTQLKQVVLQSFNGAAMGKWDIKEGSTVVNIGIAQLQPGQYTLTTIDQNGTRQAHKFFKK
ncbi:MAG: T9SS type A sorting domain-containing protein [Dinghuibacter sp.]|nr:T9SS type A sorting domain-containing protein [Dinghuibacter sp.]